MGSRPDGFYFFGVSLEIPDGVSFSADVVFHADPEGEDHVEDEGGADCEEAGVDEEEADVACGHVEFVADALADAEDVGFDEEAGCFYGFHAGF